MKKSKNQKIKLIKLLDYLKKESDYDNPKTTNELVNYLENTEGISCDRRTLYEDIKTINESGHEIMSRRYKNGNAYYVEDRDFETAELKILMDAVQAASCITEKKTAELIERIASQAGKNKGDLLKENSTVFNTRKHKNELIFINIDNIENAIQKKRFLTFLYYSHTYSGDKAYHNNGRPKVVKPVHLIFNADNYYLRAYDTDNNSIRTYRIDRMEKVSELKPFPLPIIAKDIIKEERKRISTFTSHVFNMFEGNREYTAVLEFKESIIDAVFDQFGENTKMTKDLGGGYIAKVPVSDSGTFFGWVFEFGDAMTILGPTELRKEFENRLCSLKDKYSDKNIKNLSLYDNL